MSRAVSDCLVGEGLGIIGLFAEFREGAQYRLQVGVLIFAFQLEGDGLECFFVSKTEGGIKGLGDRIAESCRIVISGTATICRRFEALIGRCSCEGVFRIDSLEGSEKYVAYVGMTVGLANNYGHALFDNTCFLSSYLSQRIAQELLVVEADVGDDCKVGRDNIGAIKATTEAYFYDSYVHLLLGKVLKSEGCSKFEERRAEWLEEVTLLFHKINDALLGNHLAVHTYAFAKIYQMR